jgi:methionine aminotransferase
MPASKLPGVGTTIFTVMSRLAAETGAINLGQGFPDFDPPARLRELVSKFILVPLPANYRRDSGMPA